MKKRLLLLVFCVVISISSANAVAIDENFGFEKVMLMRNDIQNRLDLTSEQQMYRSKINAHYHPLYNQKFVQIGDKLTELRLLADSSDCTKEKVDELVREFKVYEDELFEINKNYENNIKAILTPKQKIKYSFLRMQNRMKLKRELNKELKEMKKQDKSKRS